MVKLTGLLVLLAAIACANMVTAEEVCCQGQCTGTGWGAGHQKYYSIWPLYGVMQCHESCLQPAAYPFWHGYDKKLTIADNDYPCKAFGYTEYHDTDTDGVGTYYMTEDVYRRPNLSAAVPPMICRLVENQILEKKVIDEICSKEHKMPTTECEAALPKLWDVITHMECPKDGKKPNLVCELVKLPELEKKAVDAICSKQHIVPAAECEEGLTKVWDALVKRECPDKVEITSETKQHPCCEGYCAGEGWLKYYSVAKSTTGKMHCGESCLGPNQYKLFRFLEKNLTKADNDSPCKVFGYTAYDSTDTHNFGRIIGKRLSLTLDFYNQPDSDAIVV